jgi:FixJ family two-component response regulator
MNESANARTISDKEIVAIIDDDESIRRALLRTLVATGM